MNRRPLTSRNTSWANTIASFLVRQNISPNQISTFSIVFSLISCFCFIAVGQSDNVLQTSLLLFFAAAGIQLRLLCNLFDGMVAIEGGKRTPLGDIYNELPDRISDAATIIPIGYMLGDWNQSIAIAWFAAVVAIITAYIRSLGGALSGKQIYAGPMAKPHRMALITATCLLSIILLQFNIPVIFLFYTTLLILLIGGIITCINRLYKIKLAVNEKSAS